MSTKIKFELLALLESISKVELYSQDFVEAEDFYHDQKSFDASMMQFVVIGEVISRLDDNFKISHDEIPWQKIKDFGIDADEIWDIMQNKLLPLKSSIQTLVDAI